jgi:type VI secretion system protein ImpF
MKAATYQQREDVGRVIETMVSLFEPRLQKVRATMLDQDDGVETRVRFRIDARLRVDPAPEVAFDTILELTTGHYSVKSAAV